MTTANRQKAHHTSIIAVLIFNGLVAGWINMYGQTPRPGVLHPMPANLSFPQQHLPGTYNNTPVPQSTRILQQTPPAIIQQTSIAARQGQRPLAELQQDIADFENKQKFSAHLQAAQPFHEAYQAFLQLNPDSFSITKAIFLVENAFDNNTYSYQQFENAVKQRADFVKQILNREGINSTSNTALNYGIQKLYSQPNNVINPKTKQVATLQPFKYDFKDYMGKQDHRQMFVSKLLMTGKGQCHSMPLLYLSIAEQTGAKAYLSLAPEHSFIQFFDEQGKCLFFETTNGNLVSQSFMLQSGYINAAALKNKLFLDTLSSRRLFAQCLADLLMGYKTKFGYDDFTNELKQQILKLDPNNLTVSIINESIATYTALQKIKAAGSPPVRDLPNYPDAYQAYLAMHESYKKTDDLGYQQMPEEVYRAWRSSAAKEKKKQETRQMVQRLKAEIDTLKKLNPKIKFTPKG